MGTPRGEGRKEREEEEKKRKIPAATWRVEVGRSMFMLGDLTEEQQAIERQLLDEGVGEFGTPCQSLR